MIRFIDFHNSENSIEGCLCFFVHIDTIKRASYNDPEGTDFWRFFSDFSRSTSIFVSEYSQENKNGEIVYLIYSKGFTIRCVANKERGNLQVKSLSRTNLIAHNAMIRSGISLGVDHILVKIYTPDNNFENYLDGERTDRRIYSSEHTKALYSFLNAVDPDAYYEEETEENEETEFVLESELSKLLTMADSYAEMQYEIETEKAHKDGQIIYSSKHPVKLRKRKSRIAYEFVLSEEQKIDEKLFIEGAQVDISPNEQTKYVAEIKRITRDDLDDSIKSMTLLFVDENISYDDIPETGIINISASPVIRDVQIEAIERIRNNTAKAKYLNSVLGKNQIGEEEEYDKDRILFEISKEKYTPNKSQIDAIIKGIAASDVHLVMGPPGTGKTTVIQQWVKYYTSQNKRVLISSKNNKAVDNVLEKFVDNKEIEMIRIGSEEKVEEVLHPYIFDGKVEKKRQEILENTEEKLAIIDEYLNNNRPYVDEYRSLVPLYKKGKETERLLNDQIIILKKKRKELNNLYNRYVDNLIKINQLILRYVKNQKEKIELENIRGFGLIGRLMVKLLKKRIDRKIERTKSAYDWLKNSTNALIHNYQDRYNHFFNDVETAKDQYREIKNIVTEIQKGINIGWPENISFPEQWKITDEIEINNDSVEDVMGTMNRIIENNDKVERVREILNIWLEETTSQKNYALSEVILENVNVVGATCIGVNSQKRFASLDFDVSIIDEAGQIQIHDALVPMSVSNKLIMLGDHKQIPPIAEEEMIRAIENNEYDASLLKMSLFEFMYERLPENAKSMLDTQYRIPAHIAQTLSDWFYNKKYLSYIDNYSIEGIMNEFDNKSYVIVDTSLVKNRYERLTATGRANDLEADICCSIIEKLVSDYNYDMKNIGVISAYKDQVHLIRKKVKSKLGAVQLNEVISTLDSFQGQEREIIIYSFTRSSGIDPRKPRIGFLKELRRLNVAMSRGKKQLVLVGDMTFLSGCRNYNIIDGEKTIEGSEIQFSNFIKNVINDVKKPNNNSIYLTYDQFVEKMKGEANR